MKAITLVLLVINAIICKVGWIVPFVYFILYLTKNTPFEWWSVYAYLLSFVTALILFVLVEVWVKD